jgi:hypothetical protein
MRVEAESVFYTEVPPAHDAVSDGIIKNPAEEGSVQQC